VVTYADETEVMRLLDKVDPTAEETARIAQLNEELSRVFDEKTDRTFGGGAVAPTTRGFSGCGGSVLVLPYPALSVTSVATGGDWDGSTMAGETVLGAADWRPWQQDADGRIWAIRRERGVWESEVRVTGVWADNPGGSIPADVVALVTWLVAEHEMLDHTSPAGIEGPSGMELRPRNPWSYERTKTLIAKYRLPRMVV